MTEPIDDEFAEMQDAMGRAALARLFPGLTLEEVAQAVEEEFVMESLDPTPLPEGPVGAAIAATTMLVERFVTTTENTGWTDEEVAEVVVAEFYKRVPGELWPPDIAATAAIVRKAREDARRP